MLRVGLLALSLAACASAEAQAPPQPSEVLLGLGGYCWQADLGDGVTDTHCFSIARGGQAGDGCAQGAQPLGRCGL